MYLELIFRFLPPVEMTDRSFFINSDWKSSFEGGGFWSNRSKDGGCV